MKKTTILIMIGLICSALVLAGIGVGVINIDKEINLPPEKVDVLTSINLNSYQVTDYNLSGNYQRCLHKQHCEDIVHEECDFNNTCINITRQDCRNVINKCSTFYTNISKLDIWENKTIYNIAKATLNRQANQKVVMATGQTQITEKN